MEEPARRLAWPRSSGILDNTPFQSGTGSVGPTTVSLGTVGGCGSWWTAARLPNVWGVTATGLCGLNMTEPTAATLVTIGAIRCPLAE